VAGVGRWGLTERGARRAGARIACDGRGVGLAHRCVCSGNSHVVTLQKLTHPSKPKPPTQPRTHPSHSLLQFSFGGINEALSGACVCFAGRFFWWSARWPACDGLSWFCVTASVPAACCCFEDRLCAINHALAKPGHPLFCSPGIHRRYLWADYLIGAAFYKFSQNCPMPFLRSMKNPTTDSYSWACWSPKIDELVSMLGPVIWVGLEALDLSCPQLFLNSPLTLPLITQPLAHTQTTDTGRG